MKSSGEAMTDGGRHSVLRFLHGLLARPRAGESADGPLLHRFVTHGDEDAFAALVQRHGPMVLGLCRRLLHDAHDAEDAFQATFLILVRKAGSVARPALLGNWLYGVAYRVALRARGARTKRRAREVQAVDLPAPERPPGAGWSDLRPVLDEEVNRLPDKYRVPFVLCYLEGKTNAEAAALLGSPEGTILSRLATARQRLRCRLTRRGITLSAEFIAAAVAQSASAAVPASLVTVTARAAAALGRESAASGAVSATAAAWAKGVQRAMFWNQVKTTAALLLTAVLALAGTLLLPGWPSPAEQPQAEGKAGPAPPPPAAPAPPADRAVGKNCFVFPIRTELQRALLPWDGDKRTTKAVVVIDGMSLVRPDGSVDSTALDFAALRKALKPYAGKGHGVFLQAYFLTGTSQEAAAFLCWALEGFGRETGFDTPRAMQTWFNGQTFDWKAETEAARKTDPEGDEPGTGDAVVKVYPVRTALSRQRVKADCVVDILVPLEGDGDGLKPGVREAIVRYVGQLNLTQKGSVRFRVRRRGNAAAFGRFRETTAPSLARSLGFKSHSVEG
jgi:RNA polymerase sigma factor (sigma-70 family)